MLNVLSPAFVAEGDSHFDNDRSRCERLTLRQWQRRGLLRRTAEAVLSPVKGQI